MILTKSSVFFPFCHHIDKISLQHRAFFFIFSKHLKNKEFEINILFSFPQNP